jgi:galactokinase
MHIPGNLVENFQRRFGAMPKVFRAPGRVNLIGEHTDYNNGFVMPAAIEFSTWVAMAPRDDRNVLVHSTQFAQDFEFSLTEPATRQHKWTDYVQGVAVTLQNAGFRLTGANLLVNGEVPLGSGLSSSAALEVATALALLAASGQEIGTVELARLCQRAENQFVGARCGIMDQFICCLGKQGHCLMIDCESLGYVPLPVPDGAVLVISNTMVKHAVSGGEYNVRRSQCEEGVALLSRFAPSIRSLRDVSADQLDRHGHELRPVILKRCRHVVSENQRVRDAAEALKNDDLDRFGRLMKESHASLRDDYEVSCAELDLMVEIALRQPGTYGARMTGGGFGGCIISLVDQGAGQPFIANVAAEYERSTGIKPEIYISTPSQGAQQVL